MLPLLNPLLMLPFGSVPQETRLWINISDPDGDGPVGTPTIYSFSLDVVRSRSLLVSSKFPLRAVVVSAGLVGLLLDC